MELTNQHARINRRFDSLACGFHEAPLRSGWCESGSQFAIGSLSKGMRQTLESQAEEAGETDDMYNAVQ
jgi:hypothetical protein